MSLFLLAITLHATAVARAVAAQDAPVLARVDLAGPVAQLPLPVHGLLRDAAERDYALVIAAPAQLTAAGWPYRILNRDASTDRYIIARPMRDGAVAAAAGRFDVIEDDGVQWLVRLRNEEEVASLGDLGFAVVRLSEQPLVWQGAAPARFGALFLETFSSNASVAAMMSGVTSNYLLSLVSQISGEEPAPAGGELRVVTTRKTSSGAAARKATEFGYEFMSALGLNPTYETWSRNGYANTNVVGAQVGTTASNELVLVVAHLDDMPSSGRAPGADDNGSGSAAVLATASVLSQYRFERSVRYVLFTGEEQGLLGSAAYADAAYAASNNIVAVLNLDMIAWDSLNGPTLLLYTHSIGHPNYTNDLLIAITFTNVVATYGLQDRLTPIITPNSGMTSSDHSSFWNKGYPAILAIEHYGSDFNAYYHTVNDKLANMNIPYFTAFAQAAAGTIAHLAGPVEPRAFDVVRVVTGDWAATNTDFGASVFHAKHEAGAQETTDGYDTTYTSLPTNPHAAWLKLATRPGADDLAIDSRAVDSQTIYEGALSVVAPVGQPVSCTNRLRFAFVTPPASQRLYTVRVTVAGQYTAPATDFLCVTNLSDLVAGGGILEMPVLANVTNGATYGWCDIGARFLDQDAFRVGLRIASIISTQVVLEANGQVGTRIIDEVQLSTDLASSNAWSWVAAFTNDVSPDADNFDAGWTTLARPVDIVSVTNSSAAFFRIRRIWLAP